MLDLEILPESPASPDARALIAASEAELAAIYPPEERFAFSPQELIDAGVHFVVARRRRVAVGCGGLAPMGDWGELKRMFTAPEARGHGVAAAIVAALEEEALRRGMTVVRLETGMRSAAALRLYARLGYARRGPFGDYAENGSSVFMEKRLAG